MLKGVAAAALCLLLGACTAFKLGVANAPARFSGIERRPGIEYHPAARLQLDVYAPRGARGAPVVVFWYGGGFVSGRREQYRFVGAALAQRGLIAVLPDYRQYPPAVFPDFARDAALAVKWARDHAAEQGGDPARIFLMGHSAGGYLASLIALDRRYLEAIGAADLRIRGFIALSGPHVLDPNTDILRSIFAEPWKHGDWQPVAQVGRHSPPALLIHGLADTLVGPQQSEALAAALRAAGGDARLLLLDDRSHEDTIAALSLPLRGRAPVLEETLAFVQRWSAN